MTSEYKLAHEAYCTPQPEFDSSSCNSMVNSQSKDCVIEAIAIAIRNDRNTRATPDVPELVRYSAVKRYGREEVMENDEHGEYVRHDQAATVIADEKQAAIDARNLLQYEKDQQWQDRAETAEAVIKAKDAEIEGLAQDSDGRAGIAYSAGYYQAECNLPEHEREVDALAEYRAMKAKLAQIEKQEAVAWQWRSKLGPHGWGCASLGYEKQTFTNDQYEQIPLYAAPVVSDADLSAERDRYKQALEFYADKTKWESSDFQHGTDEHTGHNVLTLNMPDAVNDQGETARAALKQSEQQA